MPNRLRFHDKDETEAREARVPDHRDVLQRIADSHVLLHPALHEAFGNVCLEALAIGKPVVCLNVGGPAAQVTPDCGFAAPVDSPQTAILAMADFIEKIYHSSVEYDRLCAGARHRANSDFHLDNQFEKIDRIYQEIASDP